MPQTFTASHLVLSQGGAVLEPVTGLAYLRDRWCDAATGTF